jgi:hypothetical protein
MRYNKVAPRLTIIGDVPGSRKTPLMIMIERSFTEDNDRAIFQG